MNARRLVSLCLLAGLSLAPMVRAESPHKWQDVIHPGHRASVQDPMHYVDLVNANLPKDAAGLSDLGKVKELVAGEALPLKLSELVGDWRCRSLQVADLGVFVYPFFKCRIKEDPSGLFFQKVNGSQRRSGLLFADGDRRLVFLGGQTVNDDPVRPYSALMTDADGEDFDMDTVGVLQKKGKDRYVMILDANSEGYELYELVK